MSERSIDIIQSVATQVEEEIARLKRIEELAKQHPEWQEQEPQLRLLLQPIKRAA